MPTGLRQARHMWEHLVRAQSICGTTPRACPAQLSVVCGCAVVSAQLSEMQRLASGRSDGSSGLLKSSADSVLTGTSPPNGDSPLASFGTLNLDYPVLGSGADVQKSQSQLAATAEATSALCLRTSLVVGASTDIYQAAELLRLSLQQSGVSSFVLQAPLGPITAPGAQATLCAALRVAVAARQSHAASRASTDLAILPVLPSQAPEAAPDRVDLHVYEVTATLPATLQGQLAQVRVDLNSNPWLLVMQLTQVSEPHIFPSQHALAHSTVCRMSSARGKSISRNSRSYIHLNHVRAVCCSWLAGRHGRSTGQQPSASVRASVRTSPCPRSSTSAGQRATTVQCWRP